MLKLKTRWFNKWANKNSVPDSILLITIDAIKENLNTANLGSGLYKIRVKTEEKGKSGGHRTLVAYKELDKAIFVYAFSKSDKSNLNKEELKYFRKLAKDLLQIDKEEYGRQIELGHFFIIKE